jgi:hypothetical protein
MRTAPRATDPVVLSYLALRKAVGVVAIALPFAVAIPYWLHAHVLEKSISSYYYTGMRNLFVGSLCAIAMFMLCCRGYDLQDEIAGTFSAICAMGVAFFPTSPDLNPTSLQKHVGTIHYTFAAPLFLTLAYFCLVLFKLTAPGRQPTPQKKQRNLVYTASGIVILVSIALLALLVFVGVDQIGPFGTVFFFETTSLLAFGFAWLIKGETFLKDAIPTLSRTVTTDGRVMDDERTH